MAREAVKTDSKRVAQVVRVGWPMTEATLTGVQRAAVLLLSLGELDAAEVLRHMEQEVQKIGIAMATMTDITREQVERVMDQFGQELGSKTSLGVGSDDYIRNMLVQALGSEGRQPDRPHPAGPQHHRPGRAEVDGPARGGRPGAQRASADHRHRDGAPETDQAADALKLLPDRTRVDVLLRIATLDGIRRTRSMNSTRSWSASSPATRT